MERWPTIRKQRPSRGVAPNMADYVAERAAFTWEAARSALDGLPCGRGLNIAYEAVDRHAASGRADHVALRCLDRVGGREELSFRELSRRSNRFANVLRELGVARSERVFVLMPRSAALFVTVLGALKHGCVVSPLFAAFGPEPIRQRLALGQASVLVTTPNLYGRKVATIRTDLPALRYTVTFGGSERESARDGQLLGVLDVDDLLQDAGDDYEIGPTDPEETALLHFTSGTTGPPKGAIHVHDAVVCHCATGRSALDLHPDDVYWCTADPGWVTGTSYGIVAPLVNGVTSVADEAEFDVEHWYDVLESERVSVWYTSPTALRMLRAAGAEPARAHDLRHLRFVASVGEPLGPELVAWADEVLGVPVHDNWWQTETGAVMIANFACMDIRPGSMGRPVPGIDAAVLRRGSNGHVLLAEDGAAVEAPVDEEGELALRPGWPSMFRGYLGDEEQYHACFAGGWYLTGDLVRRDADGYFWFVGRGDDVIKSAGHLIGPFEVESTLSAHPAVAEVAVVGKPDPVVGEVVKAFVSLRKGFEPSDDLRLELVGFARARLGAAIAPREIAFDQCLPHTTSGKIMRRALKARELGRADGTPP